MRRACSEQRWDHCNYECHRGCRALREVVRAARREWQCTGIYICSAIIHAAAHWPRGTQATIWRLGLLHYFSRAARAALRSCRVLLQFSHAIGDALQTAVACPLPAAGPAGLGVELKDSQRAPRLLEFTVESQHSCDWGIRSTCSCAAHVAHGSTSVQTTILFVTEESTKNGQQAKATQDHNKKCSPVHCMFRKAWQSMMCACARPLWVLPAGSKHTRFSVKNRSGSQVPQPQRASTNDLKVVVGDGGMT